MDARVRRSQGELLPRRSRTNQAPRISRNQQRVNIPQGALGVYPQDRPPAWGIGRVSWRRARPISSLSTTTLSCQPIIVQYFKIRAGVDVVRAEAAGARADERRSEDDIAFKVKQVYYSILAAERRRDAVDAQIRAAELRIIETQRAVVTGVALELKADEVRYQIAQARHGLGQLQDSVADLNEELADLVGLPLDTKLALTPPDGASVPDLTTVRADYVSAALAQNPRDRNRVTPGGKKARAAVRAARAEYIPEIEAFAQYIHRG